MRIRQGAITHYGLQRYEVFSDCANFCCLFCFYPCFFYAFVHKKVFNRAKESGHDVVRSPIP